MFRVDSDNAAAGGLFPGESIPGQYWCGDCEKDSTLTTESTNTWILIDAQIPSDLRVLAVGESLKNGAAWRSLGRLVVQRELSRAVATVMATHKPVDLVTDPVRHTRWRVVVEPALGPRGDVHAVLGLVTDHLDEPLPPRPVVGAWLWDMPARITYWSKELRDLYRVDEADQKFCYSPAEFFERIDLTDHMRLRMLWGGILTCHDEDLRLAEFGIVRDDGVKRRVRLTGRPVLPHHSTSEHPVMFRGITQDITPEKVPGSAFEANSLQSAVDAFAKGLVQLTTQSTGVMDGNYGQMIHWITDPPAWLKLPQTMVIAEQCHPDDRCKLLDFVRTMASSSGVITTQVRLHRATQGWVATQLTGVKGSMTSDGSPQIIVQFTPLELV